jgi:probable rRNA maturation factor
VQQHSAHSQVLHALSLSIQFGDAQHRALLKRALLKRWVSAALQSCESNAEITLRFVSAEEGRALNHSFRRKNYATNVLTFDYARQPVLMADIVLCCDVIEREALEQDKTLIAHYAHMVMHGVLHARGYDHVRAKEAKAMEALEVQLLHDFGFSSPYE